MQRIQYFAAVAVVVGLTLAIELGTGRLTFTEDRERALAEGAVRVASLPRDIGEWRLEKEQSLSERALEMLECAAHFDRTYLDNETGESVQSTLLFGPSGPLITHTPEVCFSTQNWEQSLEPKQITLRGEGAKADVAYMVEFKSTRLEGDRIRVYYAWHRDGRWVAPKHPRLDLGAEPTLYKFQVALDASGVDPEGGEDAGLRFLKNLLPAFDQTAAKAATVAD